MTEVDEPAARGMESRTVRDREGQTWIVREYVRTRNGIEDRSLLFDCGMAIRRVRGYPAGWRGLSDEELLEVSRRR